MVIPVICLTMLLTAPVAADSQSPTTRPAPLAGSMELQAEWDRYFPVDAQQALAAVVDEDRIDVGHRAFFVLWDAAGKLTDKQLKTALEIEKIDELIENPQKYRGRLISIYVVVRQALRPEERIHPATGEAVMIHAADCVRKTYTLRAWTHEAGGRTGRNESLLVRGFFYKTFRYQPQGTTDPKDLPIGLGLVGRYVRRPAVSSAFTMPAWLPFVLGGVLVIAVAVAILAFVLKRRSAKAAGRRH